MLKKIFATQKPPTLSPDTPPEKAKILKTLSERESFSAGTRAVGKKFCSGTRKNFCDPLRSGAIQPQRGLIDLASNTTLRRLSRFRVKRFGRQNVQFKQDPTLRLPRRLVSSYLAIPCGYSFASFYSALPAHSIDSEAKSIFSRRDAVLGLDFIPLQV